MADGENSTHTGALTWMDILQFHVDSKGTLDDTTLHDVLDTCLGAPDWYRDPIESDLFNFLALCWSHPFLRVKIRTAMKDSYFDASMRADYIECIENIATKAEGGKKKGKKDKAVAYESEPETDTRKPIIVADMTNTEKVVNECLDAIMKSGFVLFQRDGSLSVVGKSKRKGQEGNERDIIRLKIIEPSVFYVMELATKAATWYVSPGNTSDVEKFQPGACPKKVIEHLQGRPDLPLPILTGVITTPTLRRNGSIISAPGYDEETGLFYEPAYEYPEIPDNPTYQECLSALELLKKPLADFQFDKDCHKSAALSGILSIHCRHLCRTVPMHAVTSNTRGAGKGLLVNVCAVAATGQEPAKRSATRDDEEMRKSLLVIAQDGDRITVFDNVPEGVFGTPSLERVLTEPIISDRILGVSKSAEAALQTTFFATGNNMAYSGDMARRILPIVLAPTTENPEQRTDFQIERLLAWTHENHTELVAAALTILRGYILVGKPAQGIPQYGSFEDWSDLVRSCIVWLGEDDPNEGRADLEVEADPGYQNLQTLIMAWRKALGMSIKKKMKDVVDLVKLHSAWRDKGYESLQNPRSDKESQYDTSPKYDETFVDLGESLLAFDPKANGKVLELSQLRISQRLPVNSGASRVIDGMRLQKEVDKHSKVNLWWVAPMGEETTMVDDEEDLPF